LTYDFSNDHLTPDRERDILLAISFIHGKDELKKTSHGYKLSNASGKEGLDSIRSVNWRTHRSFKVFFRRTVLYLWNLVKSIFVSTRPWERSDWNNPNFHLHAETLWQYTSSHNPMWYTIVEFCSQAAYFIVDIFGGIRNFGSDLAFRLPSEISNDWVSSEGRIFALSVVCEQVKKEIEKIMTHEQKVLNKILGDQQPCLKTTSHLAHIEYKLTSGDQTDILTSFARGLLSIGRFFAHNIYAKDPVGGVLFSLTYTLGVLAIYSPVWVAEHFGVAYVEKFAAMAYALGGTERAAAIAGGSTQAQLVAMAWDGLLCGPNSQIARVLHRSGEDPVTVAGYLLSAYGLGRVLVEGVDGYVFPWSEHLRRDLGSFPDISYMFIAAKTFFAVRELLNTEIPEKQKITKNVDLFEIETSPDQAQTTKAELDFLRGLTDTLNPLLEKAQLMNLLATSAPFFPQLSPKLLMMVSDQIQKHCDEDNSRSLHKLLYPERQYSIAFQTVVLPLSYIPAVVRLLAGCVSSGIAFVMRRERPFSPLRRAAGHLGEKIKKDLSRLLVFISYVLYIPYLFFSTLLKATAYTLEMLGARIMAYFGVLIGRPLHQFFAEIHITSREITETIYPAGILKAVESAHPHHTFMEFQSTYESTMRAMERNTSGRPSKVRRSGDHRKEIELNIQSTDSKTLEPSTLQPVLEHDLSQVRLP
jgi:hypothetical protein